jgi:hypothetical protein
MGYNTGCLYMQVALHSLSLDGACLRPYEVDTHTMFVHYDEWTTSFCF